MLTSHRRLSPFTLIVVLVLGGGIMLACGEANATSTVVATATTAPTATNTPAPVDCGSITAGLGSISPNNYQSLENCYISAFQACNRASLTLIFPESDSQITDTLGTQSGGSSCTATVHERRQVNNDAGTDTTTDFTCTTLAQVSGQYVLSGCSNGESVPLPSGS